MKPLTSAQLAAAKTGKRLSLTTSLTRYSELLQKLGGKGK